MTNSTATLPAAATQIPLTAVGTNAAGDVIPGVIPEWSEADGTMSFTPNEDGSVNAIRNGVDAGVAHFTASFTNTIASPDGTFLTVTAEIDVTVEAAIVTPPPPDDIVTDLVIVPGQPS